MSLGGLAIIFTYTNLLGGWRPDEVLALVGVYFLVGGMIGWLSSRAWRSLSSPSATARLILPDQARRRPGPDQRTACGNIRTIDFMMGIGVLVYALARLGETVGFPGSEFIVMLLRGDHYLQLLADSGDSFFLVRAGGEYPQIFQSMYEAGRWPVSLYPGWLRYGLTFIVPVAFATTIPTEALTGRLSWQTLLWLLCWQSCC